MPPTLQPDDRFVPSPDVLLRELDGEAVLLDVASGRYFGLNGSGLRIWSLLARGQAVGEIAATLGAEIAADADRLRADVEELVAALESEGLVRRGG